MVKIDTPYILGRLESTTPGCTICPSIISEIDGTWYNDDQFLYCITLENDTIIMEYGFHENGNVLYLNGIGSETMSLYFMIDSLYLVRREE